MRYTYILLFMIIMCGCCRIKFPNDYDYVESPNGRKCITIVTKTYLFDCKNNKSLQGMYLYYGRYSKSDKLPDCYLKIEYSDHPIYFNWKLNPTRLIYSRVLENKLDTCKINFSSRSKLSDKEYENGKIRMKEGFELFFLDDIFHNKVNDIREKNK